MLRGQKSRPHCRDTVLRYAVTLQVCTHPKLTTLCVGHSVGVSFEIYTSYLGKKETCGFKQVLMGQF
jgi:hypothetical protein